MTPNEVKTVAHAIDLVTGDHYDLARYVEHKGFEVVGDPDDVFRSFIAAPGPADFGDRTIGSIVGGYAASIKMRDLDDTDFWDRFDAISAD